ncbi:Ion channel [Vagococcus penaei]|uniref:Ion channel n=1 Tax=Vagococcus penaei TaxID=633807 RepID=A0A1Q2D6P8_9ENTE|nr:potassium channel family protein [Vagococcus penaei]AQP54000.1 Ion channel [Vagococcus penaei]RST97588.1 Ion channel [Vagococcus penaei]
MLSLFISIKKLLTSIRYILQRDDTKSLLVLVLITLISGTIFYSTVENLTILNAFYLSFTTLTTIGYGDIYPQTDLGKLFTIIYALVGIGLMALFISVVSRAYLYSKTDKKKESSQNNF